MDQTEDVAVTLLRKIAEFWFSGCSEPEYDDTKAELCEWKVLGMLAHQLVEKIDRREG